MVGIKDLKMPSCCRECEYTPTDCSYCLRLHQAIPRDMFNTSRLSNCPLVEIEERKIGKWIYHEKSKSTCFKEFRECSCCHCYFKWEMPRNSYCPNCGAEMRGSENG